MKDINYHNLSGSQKETLHLIATNPLLNPAGWLMQRQKDKKAEKEAQAAKAEQDALLHQQRMAQLSQNMGTSAAKDNTMYFVIAGAVVFMLGAVLLITRKKNKK